MQNMAGAAAEDAVYLRFKAFKLFIRNKGKRRTGKAAAMNADSAFSVQNFAAYRQRERHILMHAFTRRGDVLEIEKG